MIQRHLNIRLIKQWWCRLGGVGKSVLISHDLGRVLLVIDLYAIINGSGVDLESIIITDILHSLKKRLIYECSEKIHLL